MSKIPNAARITDPIEHTFALAGAIGGLIVGLVVGVVIAALVVATIATGGGALVLLAAFCTAMTALSLLCTCVSLGFGLGEFLGSLFGSISGAIATGSGDTFIGSKNAARREEDKTTCHGQPIAQGSKTVFINDKNAARVGDKVECGGKIHAGCATVGIGGEATETEASEVPEWLEHAVEVVDKVGVYAGLIGGFAGMFKMAAKEGLWAALKSWKAWKEPALAGIDVGLLNAEEWAGHHYGKDSVQYKTLVWTRRAYEAGLVTHGAHDARNELNEAKALKREAAEARELHELREATPSKLLGPNGERINQLGEPMPHVGPQQKIIMPGEATPNPGAKLIMPGEATPNPGAKLIMPGEVTPNPGAKLILPGG
jgi:uncharacterized Zn-binding protein involved in type VI secretion